jgi:hypothetical protein
MAIEERASPLDARQALGLAPATGYSSAPVRSRTIGVWCNWQHDWFWSS